MIMNAKLKVILIFFLTCFSLPSFAQGPIHWMNGWDQSCYDNGDNTCRKDWYSIPQGSHLVRWKTFLNIEKADSQELFSSRENLEKLGFLYPEDMPYSVDDETYNGDQGERVERYLNQSDLPFGFVKDQSQLDYRNYLGLTCAACHTGKVTLAGNTYYVEGGQSNSDMLRFLRELSSALYANKHDPAKLKRYKRRYGWFAETNLNASLEYVSNYEARNQTALENGPARLDAIGAILNQVHVDHTGSNISNATALTAPVSYPYIWNASSLECVQTNCLGTDPITRNTGEVLGVFGYANIDENENIDDMLELFGMKLGLNNLFDATPKVDNLFELEQTLNKVHSPKWPNSFPIIDQALASHGKNIYASTCAGCHVDTSDGIDDSELTTPNSIGRRFTKVTRVHYTDVGTDEAFAEDYGLRKEKSGILGSVLASQRPDSVDPETGIPFGEHFPDSFNALVLLGIDTRVIVANHQETLGFKIKAGKAFPNLSSADAVDALINQYAAGNIDQQPITPTSYRAKPLDGIAFTGPFLHNGSVRTLEDLLKAPADRPVSFLIGSTEFDTDGVGYTDAGDFLLDTTIRGNGKEGHEYGTQLSIYDKDALLEYMKTL